MKQIGALLIVIVFLCAGDPSSAQSHKPCQDDFNYSDAAMKLLARVADSQNRKFLQCDLWHPYNSLRQGVAHYVRLDTGDIGNAKLDIENGIDFDQFRKKYPLAVSYDSIWVVDDRGRSRESGVQFRSVSLNPNGRQASFVIKSVSVADSSDLKGKWLLEHHPKTSYSNERIEAFYFIEYFRPAALPVKYARMIQYADFMMDTSVGLFYPEATFSRERGLGLIDFGHEKNTPAVARLIQYICKATQKPVRSKFTSDSDYNSDLFEWNFHLCSLIETKIAKKQEFKTLLKAAIKEAISKHNSSELLETLAVLYDTKAHALSLKRQRIEIGRCSRAPYPLRHTFNIMQLAAQTQNLSPWLRACFELMDDRISLENKRDSADSGRTYAIDLDKVGISMPSMTMGVSMSIQNPAINHYFASRGVLGKAIAESVQRTDIEQQMISAISDSSLDTYNRVNVYLLYRKHLHFVNDDDNNIKGNIANLRNAVKTLPKPLSEKIVIRDIDFVHRYR